MTDPAWQPTELIARRSRGDELVRGTRLGELVVEGLVGSGGFGIVYRVRDASLGRSGALKEYFPQTLAQRAADGRVAPRSQRHAEPFELGLKSFVNEARLLASFDHPSLVKVWRFWAANGTAYMLMPYYEGETLRRWLSALGAPPREAWLRHLAGELCDSLGVLHAHHCVHRDIAPDNILLLHDPGAGPMIDQPPRPLLLDFGAARQVIGEATQTLTAILKRGFSPVEQYGGDEHLRQGPWTDVYALAAVLYTAVSGGVVPPSSIARVMSDEMVPARELGAGRYSPALLDAIDAGLAVRPEQRPQTMAALRERMDADHVKTVLIARPKPRDARAPAPALPRAMPRHRQPPVEDDGAGLKPPWAPIVFGVVGVALVVLVVWLIRS